MRLPSGGIVVEGNETAGDTSERRIPLIFIRKIFSRRRARTTAPTRSNRGFIAPLLEGGLSTFLCPAEIHSARKCLLKISTSVTARPPHPLSSPLSLHIGSFVSPPSVVHFSSRFPSSGEIVEINPRFAA